MQRVKIILPKRSKKGADKSGLVDRSYAEVRTSALSADTSNRGRNV